MGNLKFAAGETSVQEAAFSPNVILFWLKVEVAVTTRRLVTRAPNTLLSVIPLGFADKAVPLNNIASVGVETKFSLGGLLRGLIGTLGGMSALSSNPLLGLILFLIGLSQLATCFSAALAVTHTGGLTTFFKVSVFEKAKLEQFRDALNDRVFADHDLLRHQEVMGAHGRSEHIQSEQLEALRDARDASAQGS